MQLHYQFSNQTHSASLAVSLTGCNHRPLQFSHWLQLSRDSPADSNEFPCYAKQHLCFSPLRIVR